MTDLQKLEAALWDAHQRGDGPALVRHYTHAADLAEARGDVDACCFFLTHALVFALEDGSDAAPGLNDRLVAYGRAVPFD